MIFLNPLIIQEPRYRSNQIDTDGLRHECYLDSSEQGCYSPRDLFLEEWDKPLIAPKSYVKT